MTYNDYRYVPNLEIPTDWENDGNEPAFTEQTPKPEVKKKPIPKKKTRPRKKAKPVIPKKKKMTQQDESLNKIIKMKPPKVEAKTAKAASSNG